MSEHQLALQITYRLRSWLTIRIGALRENSAHRKITKEFLWNVGVSRCPGISNWWKFGLYDQLAGSFTPATELEINRFWTLPFGEFVWHLSTQVNNKFPADYIKTWSSPRFHLLSHSLVCIKNHLFIVVIGRIINKELEFIYQFYWSNHRVVALVHGK